MSNAAAVLGLPDLTGPSSVSHVDAARAITAASIASWCLFGVLLPQYGGFVLAILGALMILRARATLTRPIVAWALLAVWAGGLTVNALLFVTLPAGGFLPEYTNFLCMALTFFLVADVARQWSTHLHDPMTASLAGRQVRYLVYGVGPYLIVGLLHIWIDFLARPDGRITHLPGPGKLWFSGWLASAYATIQMIAVISSFICLLELVIGLRIQRQFWRLMLKMRDGQPQDMGL